MRHELYKTRSAVSTRIRASWHRTNTRIHEMRVFVASSWVERGAHVPRCRIDRRIDWFLSCVATPITRHASFDPASIDPLIVNELLEVLINLSSLQVVNRLYRRMRCGASPLGGTSPGHTSIDPGIDCASRAPKSPTNCCHSGFKRRFVDVSCWKLLKVAYS